MKMSFFFPTLIMFFSALTVLFSGTFGPKNRVEATSTCQYRLFSVFQKAMDLFSISPSPTPKKKIPVHFISNARVLRNYLLSENIDVCCLFHFPSSKQGRKQFVSVERLKREGKKNLQQFFSI